MRPQSTLFLCMVHLPLFPLNINSHETGSPSLWLCSCCSLTSNVHILRLCWDPSVVDIQIIFHDQLENYSLHENFSDLFTLLPSTQFPNNQKYFLPEQPQYFVWIFFKVLIKSYFVSWLGIYKLVHPQGFSIRVLDLCVCHVYPQSGEHGVPGILGNHLIFVKWINLNLNISSLL